MNHEFVYHGETKTVELKEKRFASFPDSLRKLEIEYTADGRLLWRDGATTKEIYAAVNGEKTYVDIDGVLYEFSLPSEESNGSAGGVGSLGDPSMILAPMPGKVVKIMVSVGDQVEPKQQMVIVEAMKMENVIAAKEKGTVKSINFAEGDQCDTETPIIELELESEDSVLI